MVPLGTPPVATLGGTWRARMLKGTHFYFFPPPHITFNQFLAKNMHGKNLTGMTFDAAKCKIMPSNAVESQFASTYELQNPNLSFSRNNHPNTLTPTQSPAV